MTDHLTKEKRSWNMSRIKSKDSIPEKLLRSALHSNGFRFRIHKNELPGKPDIVLKKYKTAIFVHGCFWHRHPNCKRATTPNSNKDYWINKFARNVERDKENIDKLEKLSYKSIIVWECELKKNEQVEKIISRIIY